MAAPHNLTTINVTAIYMMNKALSDDIDPILYMQGINWLNRTAISYATITLHVKHYKDENGIEHINSDQVLTGGITGTTENRVLDGTLRDHYDYVFGAIVGESTRRKLEDIEDDFLKGTWLSDTQEHGAICSWLRSDTEKSGYSWTSEEVWGFEEIEGERHYARRIKFTEKPGGQVVRARIVYDYVSPYDSQTPTHTTTS